MPIAMCYNVMCQIHRVPNSGSASKDLTTMKSSKFVMIVLKAWRPEFKLKKIHQMYFRKLCHHVGPDSYLFALQELWLMEQNLIHPETVASHSPSRLGLARSSKVKYVIRFEFSTGIKKILWNQQISHSYKLNSFSLYFQDGMKVSNRWVAIAVVSEMVVIFKTRNSMSRPFDVPTI